jgi:hypothetical protein
MIIRFPWWVLIWCWWLGWGCWVWIWATWWLSLLAQFLHLLYVLVDLIDRHFLCIWTATNLNEHPFESRIIKLNPFRTTFHFLSNFLSYPSSFWKAVGLSWSEIGAKLTLSCSSLRILLQVVIISSSSFLVRLWRLTGTTTANSLNFLRTSSNSLTCCVRIIFASDCSVEIAFAEVEVTTPWVVVRAEVLDDGTCSRGLLVTLILSGILSLRCDWQDQPSVNE